MTSYCQEYIANLQTQPKTESPAKALEILPKEKEEGEKEEEGKNVWEEKRVFTSVEFRSNFRYSGKYCPPWPLFLFFSRNSSLHLL
jgi:hypothetical protein